MRQLLLVVTAVAALAAGGWYVMEWMPAASIASASAATPKASGELVHPQQIRSIRLVGDRLPITILGSVLTAKVGDLLDDSVLEADRQALRAELVERGHWAADISPPAVQFGSDGAAHVAYTVVPGPVFHVRDVRVDGDGTHAEALTLTAGDDVSPSRLARNAELLVAYLARHGSPGAQVTVETSTDRDARAVDVRFVVTR
jgi:hypothetical protein